MSSPAATRRVLVTGATGTLGHRLLPRLVAAGHDVHALSRRPQPDSGGVTWSVADLRTGANLPAAIGDPEVIIHCASAQQGDEEAARRLLAAVTAGGATATQARHLVYISIVGVDRVPLAYYRSKLAVEELIAASGVPFTVVRATQFHELVLRLFAAQRRLPAVFVPSRTNFQPVDAADVADRLVRCVADGPAGRVADFGGRQVVPAASLARQYLAATGLRRGVLRITVVGAIGRAYRDGGHLTPDHTDGTRTFAQYLAARDPA